MRDFEEALERVVLGPERRSRLITRGKAPDCVPRGRSCDCVPLAAVPTRRKITIVARGMLAAE
jgi:ATP-dependent Zn protease